MSNLTFKSCPRCEIELPTDCFSNLLSGGLHGYCKKCCVLKNKIIREKLKLTPEGRRKITIYSLYHATKCRSKKENMEFDLTKEYIDSLLGEKCPVLGLTYEIKHNSPNSASVDRINNDKGYTKDNVAIISRRANNLKKDATLKELELIVKYLETGSIL